MGKEEMIKIVKAIEELTAFAEEIKDEITEKQDLLKAVMNERNTDVIDLDNYFVRWQNITSLRLDNSKMKKEQPELYSAYLKSINTRRFSISAV